jgi:hypothetical protein
MAAPQWYVDNARKQYLSYCRFRFWHRRPSPDTLCPACEAKCLRWTQGWDARTEIIVKLGSYVVFGLVILISVWLMVWLVGPVAPWVGGVVLIVWLVGILLYKIERAWDAHVERQEERHQEMLDALRRLEDDDDDELTEYDAWLPERDLETSREVR